jgi:hypothetical protein
MANNNYIPKTRRWLLKGSTSLFLDAEAIFEGKPLIIVLYGEQHLTSMPLQNDM